jgi:tetratricopeptide (TPR) repeat protein
MALDRKEYFPLTYSTEAQLLHRMQRFEEELTLLEKQEAICLEVGDKNTLLRDYVLRALALPALQRPRRHSHFSKSKKRSLVNYEEALLVGYPAYELILEECGRTEEALTVLKTFEAICLELEDKAGLALSYSTWRLLASEWGESETAKEKFQRAVELFTERNRPNDRDTIQAMLNDL